MPKYFGKDNDRNSKSPFNSKYRMSPPTQLPTLLLDEPPSMIKQSADSVDYPAADPPAGSTAHAHLIDFDTSTPLSQSRTDDADIFDQDIDYDNELDRTLSPPFREAQLPQGSPPPLPIPPRVFLDVEVADYGQDDKALKGHSRAPTISCVSTNTVSSTASSTYSSTANSSAFDNFTRTIRGYVPASILVPTSEPSPPLVPSPMGYGLFSKSSRPLSRQPPLQEHRRVAGQQEFEREYERQDDSDDNSSRGYGQHLPGFADRQPQFSSITNVPPLEGQHALRAASSGLAQAMQRSVHLQKSAPEPISWARWEIFCERKLLLLGYTSGLQIWDCSNLTSVDEVLNLNFDSAEWRMTVGEEGSTTERCIVHASVLPSPSNRSLYRCGADIFLSHRPLLGILLNSSHETEPQSIFLLYSIQHRPRLLRRLNFSGSPITFTANDHFIVISTANSAALHILSSSTFRTLHTISSTSLELFIHHSSAANVSSSSTTLSSLTSTSMVSATSSGEGTANVTTSSENQPARPVFALSHRLLAYASSSPPLSTGLCLGNAPNQLSTSSSTSGLIAPGTSVSSSSFGFGFGLGKITNMTQADVGHAALKVGESVFSGMKFLGGMALEVAKNRVTSGPSAGLGIGNALPGSDGGYEGGEGRFVSRSAPNFHVDVEEAAAQRVRERRHSASASSSAQVQSIAPFTRPSLEGHYTTVVDLGPLLQGNVGTPVKVDEFIVSRGQPVARLEFSPDGISVGVVLKDGQSLKVFRLQPSPRVLVSSSQPEISGTSEFEFPTATSVQVYDLRRGRTSAIVEHVDWAKDGRYVGVGTRNRTVHIFALNPYGGKTDIQSHLEGRVRNTETMGFVPTTLMPVARLRGCKSLSNADQFKAALAFTFVSDTELATSPNLLPPLSLASVTLSPTHSPTRPKRGTNYQHILLFNPEDGVLSLCRLTLEKQPTRETGIGNVAASVQAMGISVSLPGMGAVGRLSSSPSSKLVHIGKVEQSTEVGAKVNVVATYDLKRGKDWKEVLKPMRMSLIKQTNSVSGDWLAEAELSTCSSSQRVLPRSIYLSHQFSFYTLGEDYHALIRSYQFYISGFRLEVRKEVEVSAFSPVGNDTTFTEDFTLEDTHPGHSFFDEPIASAISGSFDNSNIPPILPMYPNGQPGSSTNSLRNSIPIRAMTGLGDGVSGSIGRIRREIHRVRSPQLSTRSDVAITTSVPLEFNEEDENLLCQSSHECPPTSVETSGRVIGFTTYVKGIAGESTRKLLDADVVGTVDEEIFDGWDTADKQAIEEAEQFDDLAATIRQIAETEYYPQQQRQDVFMPSLSTVKKGR